MIAMMEVAIPRFGKNFLIIGLEYGKVFQKK
jgi:hypothetical protein